MNRKDIEREIRTILSRVTEEDAFGVGLNEDLTNATGIDSLGRLELLSELEETFDVLLYDLESEKTSTIEGMVQIVEDALSEVV